MWDLKRDIERTIVLGHVRPVRCVLFHPDPKQTKVCIHRRVNSCILLTKKKNLYFQLPLLFFYLLILYILSYSSLLQIITSSDDRTVRVWNYRTRELLLTLSEHLGRVRALAVTETHIISGSDDHSIKIWELSTGQCVATLLGNTHRICTLQCTETRIVSVAYDAHFSIWDLSAIPTRNSLEKSLSVKQSVVPITRSITNQQPSNGAGAAPPPPAPETGRTR